MTDNPAALDRDAARNRWAPKGRRLAAKHLSAELRAAAATDPKLTDLLNAIATEMDDYLDTHVQATGTDQDPPVWQAALAVARQILGEVSGQPRRRVPLQGSGYTPAELLGGVTE